jgi:hypothetical protein
MAKNMAEEGGVGGGPACVGWPKIKILALFKIFVLEKQNHTEKIIL